MSEDVAGDEPYLLVEEVAERLGLPLSVLLHRVEAGDIPSRRVETDDGLHYALRLGDLGIELDDEGMRASAIEGGDESTLTATFEPPSPAPAGGGLVYEPADAGGFESAIVSAFNSGPPPVPAPWRHDGDGAAAVSEAPAAGTPDTEDTEEDGSAAPGAGASAETAAAAGDDEPPPPTWSARPREPQQPPPWIIQEPAALDETPMAEEAAFSGWSDAQEALPQQADTEVPQPAQAEQAPDGAEAEVELPLDVEADPEPALQVEAEEAQATIATAAAESVRDQEEDDRAPLSAEASFDYVDAFPAPPDAEEADELDEETVMAELAVPPPSRPLGLLDAAQGPRGDLASMSLDARELVAGLLDRWERTLEQRIYTEQRQRFQAELVSRQNTVKQLQMELHTARAEHAAAQAEKDRILAAKERELADRERDLAETRRQAEETQRLLAPAARRRRWFRGRDD